MFQRNGHEGNGYAYKRGGSICQPKEPSFPKVQSAHPFQVPLHQKNGVKIHQVALPQEDPVAPIVQETHGTWMAMTQSGRFAFLTNFREDPKLISPKALSRGLLVRDFVVGQSSPW